jgi:hypothetical protein
MSTPIPVLVPGILAFAPTTQALPAGNAPQASNSVIVTDSAGTIYPPVLLTGAETPTPWAYSASFAPGAATAVVTALDTAGATIGTPTSVSFTVAAAAAPATFTALTSATFTAAGASPAAAALHKAASVKT